MAHISLHAEGCEVSIKNKKIRFQAVRHDQNGQEIDRVTIMLPISEAYKFNYMTDLDKDKLTLNKGKNRLEDIVSDQSMEN